MKICVAQTRPVKGDIAANIDQHLAYIESGLAAGADVIIFPELSITGYEPALAQGLAVTIDEPRFDVFQKVSDAQKITIGIGSPLLTQENLQIGLVLFQPQQARQVYFKKYLHADEEPYFVSGESFTGLFGAEKNIAPAICYEIFVPAHAERAFQLGANRYIASVVKSVNGIDQALDRLGEVAKTYSMIVLMANSIGEADGTICAGKSSIWSSQGKLLAQLNDTQAGILVFDTETMAVVQKMA